MCVVFFKRRFVVARFGLSLGIKICVLLSVLIIYQLFQERRLETSRLWPRIIQNVDVKRTDYRLKSIGVDSTFGEFNNNSFSIHKLGEDEADEKSGSLGFFFVLHHYEQLTKTTENLIYLAAIAKEMKRLIVEPFVRDSRMCGLAYGWSGALRNERRKFYPLSLYFDVQFMNDLLTKSGISPMAKLESFKRNCRSNVAKTTLLHFMFKDHSQKEMEKWYKISAFTYQQIEENIKESGWCDCNFIDRGLNVSKRIGDLTAGRQICVDAEKVKSIQLFRNEIIKNDKCVVIIHWRGFGRDRSHFKPEIVLNNRTLVHSLQLSERVNEQANLIAESIGEEYISIHIRSERQILWYDVERLSRCLKTLVEKATNLIKRSGIKKVFGSSDMIRVGSDPLRSFLAQNSTLENKIKQLQRFLSKTLRTIKYNPKSDDPTNLDGGVVALTQMNVLVGGSHLLTVGSGTFQQWIVHGFVKGKSGTKKQNNWTITRICHKENKQNNYKSS
ncbi:uncharacterized protein [Montipora capricornis]|uniref:uncharacterized protein n=1 Tax=Montipora capricornis TaxID=246305 RepID=UPI0035F131E0